MYRSFLGIMQNVIQYCIETFKKDKAIVAELPVPRKNQAGTSDSLFLCLLQDIGGVIDNNATVRLKKYSLVE